MKAFKKYKYSALFLLIIFVSSCAEEDDNLPDTGGDDRDKFVASWTCVESSKIFGNTTYTITIDKWPTDNINIKITNFYNLGTNTYVLAAVDNDDLTISEQIVAGAPGDTTSGSGFYASNKINLTYYVNDGQTQDTVTAVCTKQ